MFKSELPLDVKLLIAGAVFILVTGTGLIVLQVMWSKQYQAYQKEITLLNDQTILKTDAIFTVNAMMNDALPVVVLVELSGQSTEHERLLLSHKIRLLVIKYTATNIIEAEEQIKMFRLVKTATVYMNPQISQVMEK